MEETRKVRNENSEATDDLTKKLHGYKFQQATTQKKYSEGKLCISIANISN